MSDAQPDEIVEIDPVTLLPSPFQVRKISDTDPRVVARVESIRKNGLIELPVIRRANQILQIATGHIRIRACVILGMKTVKCIIRKLTDEQMAIVVVEENLKHETLNPIEEGRGYWNMRDKFHWKEEEIATKFGTTRDVVAQRMRLLTFQEPIQEFVAQGQLSVSHAEAIATAPVQKQLDLARRALDGKLTVIETTTLARKLTEQERTNQQILENIGSTVINLDDRLRGIETRRTLTIIGADANGPLLLLAKPIKTNLCEHNADGICDIIYLSADQVNDQLCDVTKKLEDGNWSIRACPSVCSLCELFESRSTQQSVQNTKRVT